MDYKELVECLKICDEYRCAECKYNNFLPTCECFENLMRDSSTAITELLERAERAEKQLADAGWIPVTERLPENDSSSGKIWAYRKQYLTINVYGQVEAARFGSGAYEWWIDSHKYCEGCCILDAGT